MAIQFLPYALAALGGGARAYTAIKKEYLQVLQVLTQDIL